jgi:hypothetical protein
MSVNAWLATFPTTAGRVVGSIVVFLATAGIVAYRLAHSLPMPSGYDAWFLLLAAMAGLDTAYFAMKRFSYRPSPPAVPDVEDAKAMHRAPGTGRRVDDPTGAAPSVAPEALATVDEDSIP